MEKPSEPWIFLSHANADIVAVRRVRNKFEDQGAHPILFYLKQQVDDELLARATRPSDHRSSSAKSSWFAR
jgi:hypothetical protein